MNDALIYLDYMATTPVDPRVAERMLGYLSPSGDFGNPASNHHWGWRAEHAVARARQQVAAVLNVAPRDIVWTSGATEANNLAIKGVAQFYQDKGKHIITMKTEHPSVLDACAYLAEHGFEVSYLDPLPNGLLDVNALQAAIRDDTILISIMHVNNEIGVIQDIQAIGELARQHNIIFHVDAVQSVGKLAIDLSVLPVDLMSFSAHKIYGPKGIGALYTCHQPRVRLVPQIHGGGHERGLRSGTLPTHQIVGMGEALEIAEADRANEQARMRALRDHLWAGIDGPLEQVILNGDSEKRIAGNLNVSFVGVDSEALLTALRHFALSSGSACTSDSMEPSHVLRALGLEDAVAHSAIRFSVGRFTTEADIETTIAAVVKQVRRLRAISPLWRADHPER